MTKNIIAGFAIRLFEISKDLEKQMLGKNITMRERFFLEMLRRQICLLRDAAYILDNATPETQTTTFIIFRCLLDDFILLLYLDTKKFDEGEIISFIGQSQKKIYDMYEHSMKLNNKYFEGKKDGLATKEWLDKKKHEFFSDNNNDIYFSSVQERKWKTFPPVRSMVENFPNDDLCKANAHAFILWQAFSKYVHYSDWAGRLDRVSEARELEIWQLSEAIFYVYKTIDYISERLQIYGYDVSMKDSTNLIGDLIKFGEQRP